MACEVAGSPFSDPGFAIQFDDVSTFEDKVDFAPLEKFNSSFGALDQRCVDPQALDNAASPAGNQDASLTPDYTPNVYPSTFHVAPASPYFQSIEQSFGSHVVPPRLQNQHLHRRSVSEPPDGALIYHPAPQQDGPVTFHRSGQLLGTSPRHGPPIKRVKQTRTQPYQRSPRKHVTPTSVPHGLSVQHSPQPQHFQHVPLEHIPPQSQYVSSRVCTPAPEAIDPFLGASPVPAVAHMGNSSLSHGGRGVQALASDDMHVDKSVTVNMGIDELRALMTEAVQKAIEGLQTVNSVTKGDIVGGETSMAEPVEGVETETSSVEFITAADDIVGDEATAMAGPVHGLGDGQGVERTK